MHRSIPFLLLGLALRPSLFLSSHHHFCDKKPTKIPTCLRSFLYFLNLSAFNRDKKRNFSATWGLEFRAHFTFTRCVRKKQPIGVQK